MHRLLQFARGVLAAGLIGSLFLAVSLLIGTVSVTSLPVSLLSATLVAVFVAAALVGLAFGLIPDIDRRLQVLGCLLVGVAALGIGLVKGIGAIEVCAVLGAATAAPLVGSEREWPAWLSLDLLATVAIALAIANLVPLVLDGGGLGHDESAYALKAKHWIEGTPESGWNLHRGIAMSAYGYVIFEFGGSDAALRSWGIAAIVGLAVATWILGSRVGGRLVGPFAAIAVVSSPILLRRSTEYLSDVPAAALLMACMVIIWREFVRRNTPTYGLLWLLPFAWAAFYIRYQSVLSLALIAVTVGVLFAQKLKVGWRPVALTAGIGLVGLLPHFWFATYETGSPLGILTFTADVAGREYYGEGLVDYFLLMGWPLAAFLGPIAAVFFVWWLLEGWGDATQRLTCLFLFVPTVGQVLALGILSHGEARFIFFPLALTLVGGITGFLHVSRSWKAEWRKAISLGLVVLMAGSLALSATYVRNSVGRRIAETEVVLLSADAIRETSGDAACGVMTSYQPQITFYSGCVTAPFRTELEPEEALDRFGGDERYLLLIENGKRQPTGSELDELIAATEGEPISIEGGHEPASIYEFDDE